MFYTLFGPYEDLSWLFFRFAIALVFLFHAWPKLANSKALASGMSIPSVLVTTIGLAEFVGALSVLVGIYLEAGALLLALVMAGALYFKIGKWNVPFSAHDKMGWEFDLVLFAAALLLVTTGGGTWFLL